MVDSWLSTVAQEATFQVETVDQWKNPQTGTWWETCWSPLHAGGQNPFCFILHWHPTEVFGLFAKVGGNRSQLCTWADIRRHRWGRGRVLQPRTSCSCWEGVKGTDLMGSSSVLTSSPMYCVYSPAASLGWCIIKVMWMLPEETSPVMPCCAAWWINWFEKASWVASQQEWWLLGSVHGSAALLLVQVFLLDFFFLIPSLKHDELNPWECNLVTSYAYMWFNPCCPPISWLCWKPAVCRTL